MPACCHGGELRRLRESGAPVIGAAERAAGRPWEAPLRGHAWAMAVSGASRRARVEELLLAYAVRAHMVRDCSREDELHVGVDVGSDDAVL